MDPRLPGALFLLFAALGIFVPFGIVVASALFGFGIGLWIFLFPVTGLVFFLLGRWAKASFERSLE